MIKVIQYLQENMEELELLKQGKVSLPGVTKMEVQAIVEAFNEQPTSRKGVWF